MTVNELQKLMADNSLLTKDTLYELRNLLACYPYFQTARLLYLKNLYLQHDSSFGDELRKAALFVADRRVLFELIEDERYAKPAGKPKPEPRQDGSSQADRTMALIDAFLEDRRDEVAVSDTMDLSADYTSYLLKDETDDDRPQPDAPRLKGQDLIDCFLQKADSDENVPEPEALPAVPPVMPVVSLTEGEEDGAAEETEEELAGNEEDESCLTETLAKIYVKQQRYSKALEIIKKLSLKYPKKNAYFADQIRFLEKLIINTKSK